MNREDVPGKSPGFWFYPADYERDMQILSLAAQGLWMRMLCWMHENEAHRGFLELPSGVPMTDEDIAHRCGKAVKTVTKILAEMSRVGILTRDFYGTIFCRRMARDSHISEVRRDAANKRLAAAQRAANGTFAGDFAPANGPAKRQQNPTVQDPDPDPVLEHTSADAAVCSRARERPAKPPDPGPPPGRLAAAATDGEAAAQHQKSEPAECGSPPPEPRRIAPTPSQPVTTGDLRPAIALVLAVMPGHARHGPVGPEPRAVEAAAERLAKCRDPVAKAAEYRERHEAWCLWWQSHPGGFIPHVWRWFYDGDCEHSPPDETQRKAPMTETMRLMLEAQAEEDAKAARRRTAC